MLAAYFFSLVTGLNHRHMNDSPVWLLSLLVVLTLIFGLWIWPSKSLIRGINEVRVHMKKVILCLCIFAYIHIPYFSASLKSSSHGWPPPGSTASCWAWPPSTCRPCTRASPSSGCSSQPPKSWSGSPPSGSSGKVLKIDFQAVPAFKYK